MITPKLIAGSIGVVVSVAAFWNYYPWVFELLRLTGIIPEVDYIFLGTEA